MRTPSVRHIAAQTKAAFSNKHSSSYSRAQKQNVGFFQPSGCVQRSAHTTRGDGCAVFVSQDGGCRWKHRAIKARWFHPVGAILNCLAERRAAIKSCVSDEFCHAKGASVVWLLAYHCTLRYTSDRLYFRLLQSLVQLGCRTRTKSCEEALRVKVIGFAGDEIHSLFVIFLSLYALEVSIQRNMNHQLWADSHHNVMVHKPDAFYYSPSTLSMALMSWYLIFSVWNFISFFHLLYV